MREYIKRGIVVCLLLGVIVFGVAPPLLLPYQVHAQSAQDNIVGAFSACSASILADLVSTQLLGLLPGITVPTSGIPEIVKESIKDCLAWAITNAIIEEITSEITNWINSGFDGNPAYVTNLGGLLRSTANNAFSAFARSGWIGTVSPTFRNAVIYSIMTNYNQGLDFESRIKSTIDHTLYDVGAFISSGEFLAQGGWDTWFQLTQIPQNNPYGAFLIAQDELNRTVEESLNQSLFKIEIARGFLTKEVCEEADGPPQADGTLPPPICRTATPGSVIEQSFNQTLQLGYARIVQSDELNEALSLLFTHLISEALTGSEGLRGVGEFVQESTGFTGEDFLDGGATPEGPPTGLCTIAPEAKLSKADQDGVTNLSLWPRPARGIQIVFQEGKKYRVDTRVNSIVTEYGPHESIAEATQEFCASTNATCPGGELSKTVQESVLKLDGWSDFGGKRTVALRFETNGVHIDYYDGTAEHIGHFGPLGTIEAVIEEFCTASEENTSGNANNNNNPRDNAES